MPTRFTLEWKPEALDFIEKMRAAANGEFKKEFAEWIEELGENLLTHVQDAIISRKVMDTRLLLQSFQRGGSENIWKLSVGDLSLEVGTNVKYAAFVNDGHHTNPAGVAMRFIPGTFSGGSFKYQPGAKTGMVLKQKWVEGKHYWEAGIRAFETAWPGLLEDKLQDWFGRYFP